MPLQPAGRKRRARIAAALAALALGGACGRSPDSGAPVPALSRAGSRWDVSRGNRVVFRMENAPGRVEWPTGETVHPFISGRVLDRGEERRLRTIVLHARHFRDLVHLLERAGYGVGAAADEGRAGG